MRLSLRTQLIHSCESGAWHLHAEAVAARSRGEDVIILTVGDPDRDTPTAAVEASIAALRAGDTHYTDSRGRRSLREAVARKHSTKWATEVCPDEVTIVSGAQGGLFTAAMCLFGPGDEVLVPEPSFVSYAPVIHATGALPVAAPACPVSLRLHAESLRRAVTSRTRGIVYADPVNPTGSVMRMDELETLAAVATEFDLWLVSDEIYSALSWGAQPTSIRTLPDMAQRSVVVDGVAKSHAMTGWRVGWTVAPLKVAQAIGELASVAQHGLPGFVQEGALEAMQSCSADVVAMKASCQRRAGIVLDMLHGCPGIACLRPEAGMFVLVDVSTSGMLASTFAADLYRQTGVAVMDGAAFGRSTTHHVRLSLAVEDAHLADACGRISSFCSQIMLQAA
jgi:arginine:pyruvate transaminase